eukprot:Hpha_TRINITY_DN15656_c3_g2::TRINITY_DN15656_c3_g2_i1::g.97494::m.97494
MVVFFLRSFVRDAKEEEKIQVDFVDDDATLSMVRIYCDRMSVWLLEDIPRRAEKAMGQMELNMCQAVNALRPLRPFVPPWVFVNRPPRDLTEGAKYVEKPKYKQPSIDLTAEMAKAAEAAKNAAERGEPPPQPEGHAAALASLMAAAAAKEREAATPSEQMSPNHADEVKREGTNQTSGSDKLLVPRQESSPKLTPKEEDAADKEKADKEKAEKEKADKEREEREKEEKRKKFVEKDQETPTETDSQPRSRKVTMQDAHLVEDTGFCADDDDVTSIPQMDTNPPVDPETGDQDIKDMNGLQRTLNLSRGLHLRNDVSLVEISLRSMHSPRNHQNAPRGANYRSPETMARAMNHFLLLVADIAEKHSGAIARVSPSAVHVGFNLTWHMGCPRLCAKAACSFALELTREYDARVKALRIEEAADSAPPLEVGSKVEMRVRNGPWLEGEVTQLKPLRILADGESEPKPYPEVRPALTMCSLEQGIGSPEKGRPTIAIVTGNMFAGIVSTGTFRTFEFVGPHVTQLMKLRCLNEECGIRVLVDSWTRAMYLRAPLVQGDMMDLVGPSDRLERLCQEADKGLGWNDAMARSAGTRREVLAVNSDGTAEIQLDDTSARFPIAAVRHALPVHQVGILHNDNEPWDTRHCEVYSELVCGDVTEYQREQQRALDMVFTALRAKRYKTADRALQQYVDEYETEVIEDPEHGAQGERKTRVNISNSTHRLRDSLTHLVEASTKKRK